MMLFLCLTATNQPYPGVKPECTGHLFNRSVSIATSCWAQRRPTHTPNWLQPFSCECKPQFYNYNIFGCFNLRNALNLAWQNSDFNNWTHTTECSKLHLNGNNRKNVLNCNLQKCNVVTQGISLCQHTFCNKI